MYCGFNYIVLVPKRTTPQAIVSLSLLPTSLFTCGDGHIAVAGHFYYDDIKEFECFAINKTWMHDLAAKHRGFVPQLTRHYPAPPACEQCRFYSQVLECCQDKQTFIDAFFHVRVCRFHPNAIPADSVRFFSPRKEKK
ncbi:hypothetical protein EH223_08665 [candidate division KSB1 bacterium]|nr:MAG: hypothetical protein EH223_08665 [candidate division KSB1 bacterium]